jgi:protein-S-isoprenylcysteine O-methyltransferase Ste14
MMLLRHLLSIAILPFSVGVLAPIWIARQYSVTAAVGQSAAELAIQLAGLALLAIGLALFTASLGRFEEPMMVERFGEDYQEYCRHVGRIMPRLSPWKV